VRRLVLLLILMSSTAYADVSNQLNVEEEDGSPSTFPYKLKVSNASLTDNGDGTASLAGGSGTPGGADTMVQINTSNTFSADPVFTWQKDSNTLSISRDSGQVKDAFTISSDTGVMLASISHDGAMMVQSMDVGSTKLANLRVGGATGIRISADTGKITFRGIGGSNNEDLQLDLETTSNSAALSSSTGVLSLKLPANSSYAWSTSGTTSEIARVKWDTVETNDALKIQVDTGASGVNGSGNVFISDRSDSATNYAASYALDPTVIWQGRDETQTAERGRIHYNSFFNRFQISTDTGTVTMIAPGGVSVDSATTAQLTLNGTTAGGCVMFQDTDGAGCTECDALNGTLTCSTDADCVCD